MPDSATVAGVSGSLLLTLSVAERDPCAWGAKPTFTTQVLPGSIAAPRQSSELTRKSPGSAPVNVKPVTRSGAPPVLVTVTGCDALSVVCAWGANDRLWGETDAAGSMYVIVTEAAAPAAARPVVPPGAYEAPPPPPPPPWTGARVALTSGPLPPPPPP